MKMPIRWHEDGLRCMKQHHEVKELRCKDILQQLERDRQEISFYEHQIETARSENRDGFDRDRFLKRRDA
jgi:hypothetical protein